MKPNVAGFLCYLGMWVTGIIFLIIEKTNKTVRFHAMQSLVTFAIIHIILAIISGIIGSIGLLPYYGGFGLYSASIFGAWVIYVIILVIMWILWIVLMIKTYKDQMYKVPLFGNLAEKCLAKLDGGK